MLGLSRHVFLFSSVFQLIGTFFDMFVDFSYSLLKRNKKQLKNCKNISKIVHIFVLDIENFYIF